MVRFKSSPLQGFVLAAFAFLSIACAKTSDPVVVDNNPFGPLLFSIPQANAELSDPFTLKIEGPGIARAFFAVGQVIEAQITEAPFEFIFDAASRPKGNYTLTVIAQHSTGQEERQSVDVVVARVRPPLQDLLDQIAAMPGASWLEIPETQVRDVDWGFVGNSRGDQGAIIAAASGGALDTKRNRLVIWGSGGDIYRNDLYAFDLNTLEWSRLTDPSDWPQGGANNAFDLATHVDGAPVARHSYDAVEYIPAPVDRLYIGGGSVDGQSTLFPDPKTYLFDFDTLTWTPGVEITPIGLGTHSAIHPDGTIWQHGAGGTASILANVDLAAQASTNHVSFNGFYGLAAAADIDTSRNLYIAVGNSETRVWDLDDPDAESVVWSTTGATEIEGRTRPGVVYHAGKDRLVCWSTSRDVYVLNLDTKVWTRLNTTGDDPGTGTVRGMHGRWRYVAALDVFVTVTSVDRNVIVFRLPDFLP